MRSDGQTTRRRRKITDGFLREVAVIAAPFDGAGAGEAVRKAFYVSKPQAYRYISLARERGFLESRGAGDE